jgi:hypothetical protein
MLCPCCRVDRTGEYFHVLSPDIRKEFHFNYCCSNCLADRLFPQIVKHIKFRFSEEDKEEIRKIVRDILEE